MGGRKVKFELSRRGRTWGAARKNHCFQEWSIQGRCDGLPLCGLVPLEGVPELPGVPNDPELLELMPDCDPLVPGVPTLLLPLTPGVVAWRSRVSTIQPFVPAEQRALPMNPSHLQASPSCRYRS